MQHSFPAEALQANRTGLAAWVLSHGVKLAG